MSKTLGLLCIILVAVTVVAQSAVPKVQLVPAKHTPAYSGEAMYSAYCASCHGNDGKGAGPAAAAIKTPVPDLTILAKSHAGTFPAFMVAETLRVARPVPAHGTADMPVWGPVFSQVSRRSEAEMQLRIRNLTMYIESLQQK